MESTFSLVLLKNSYLADTGSGKTSSEQVFASGSLLYRSAKEELIMLSSHRKAWSDTYFYAQKILSEKTTHCIIPTIWHAGKGKTTETVKKKVNGCPGPGRREGGMNKGSRKEFSGQWNHSVYHYKGEYMTLCTCQNLESLLTQRVSPNINCRL